MSFFIFPLIFASVVHIKSDYFQFDILLAFDSLVTISTDPRALSKICHVNHLTGVHIAISGPKYDPGSLDMIWFPDSGSDSAGPENFQNSAYTGEV